MLVVAADPLGRFGQAQGAHRPGRRWLSPNRGNLSGARVRLSHPRLANEGGRRRGKRGFDSLLAIVSRVLNECVLKAQRDNRGACDTSGHAAVICECHAQSGTCDVAPNGMQ